LNFLNSNPSTNMPMICQLTQPRSVTKFSFPFNILKKKNIHVTIVIKN